MTAIEYPDRVELVDSRRRLVGSAMGAAGCAGAGVVMLWSGSALGWLAIGMGGAALPLMVVMALSPVRLIVDRHGLTISSPLGEAFIAWEDTADFDAGRVPFAGPSSKRVVTFVDQNKHSRRTVPADFGIDARILAAQLEQYRADASSQA